MMRQQMTAITQMLNDDLPNMGYDTYRTTVPVLRYADENRIKFYRNVYRDSNRQPELITWEFLDEPVEGSNNPDHRTLIRVEREASSGMRDTTRIESGVTRFELRYYADQHGKELTDQMNPPPGADSTGLASIKQIHLILEMQSSETVSVRAGDPDRFIRSVYDKRYSPRNLE
jgi:hypothetical protein